jgi:hypothetical protein
MEIELERENGAHEAEISPEKALTRQELMQRATEVIRYLHGRTTARTFRARKDDTQRLAWARATLQGIQGYGTLLKDAELEDLAARLDALEQRRR